MKFPFKSRRLKQPAPLAKPMTAAPTATTSGYVNPDDAERTPIGKRILVGIISFVIILVFFLLMKAVIRLSAEPEDRERNFTSLAVMVDTATLDNVQLTVSAQGETRPRIEIDLVPQVGGQIVYVSPNFIDGGLFKKGETLIRIEDADYRANVTRAQSAVAQAEQILVREVAESDIARRDYAELGTGTPSALALREPQKQQAEAALSAAKAELATANLQLGRTAVRAPFAGRVRTKEADIGQYVNPGARLGRVFSTDIAEVRLALSDTDLSKLDLPVAYVADNRAEAPSVKLSATIGGQTRSWDGHIMRTDSSFDTQTRALYAIVEVIDPYGVGAAEGGYPLAPGLFVDAEIVGKTFTDVIVVQRDAVRPGNEVYIVDDAGKASIRSVDVLDTSAERAVIRTGIAPGEYVVLSPMERSRISIPLEALDYKDPSKVLVTPVNPADRAPKVEEEAPTGFFAKLFPKKEVDPDALSREQEQELIDVMSATYAAVLRDMSETEKGNFRKMNFAEKGVFVKSRISELENKNDDAGSAGGGRPDATGN